MTPRDLAKANLENLYRIFTIPESADSTLGEVDRAISENVAGFLQEHIVALERRLTSYNVCYTKLLRPLVRPAG